MAYIDSFSCRSCGKERREVVDKDRSGVCSACRHRASSRARRTHLTSLKGLTVKERLERIEAQLYDQDASDRLARLEAQNLTVY
jgi:hypothetical protein